MWRWKAVLEKVVRFNIEQQGPPEVVFDCSSNSKDHIASYFCEQLRKFHKSLSGKQNTVEKSFQFDNLDSFTIAEKIFDHYLIAIAHEVNKLLSKNKFEPESNLNSSKKFNEHITSLSEKFPECSTISINQGICLEVNWLLQEFIELKKKQRVLIALANVLDQANEAYWYNRQEKLRGNDVNSQKTWIYWSKIRESENKTCVHASYFWWMENDG
uniref:Uncharacterized protein n=1 Tax=Ditylenchus dipsaci TaxID=166011 RepID=A0A915EMY5_9BILA